MGLVRQGGREGRNEGGRGRWKDREEESVRQIEKHRSGDRCGTVAQQWLDGVPLSDSGRERELLPGAGKFSNFPQCLFL